MMIVGDWETLRAGTAGVGGGDRLASFKIDADTGLRGDSARDRL